MQKFLISGQAIGGKVFLRIRGKSWSVNPQDAWIYKDRGRAQRRKRKAMLRFVAVVENIQVEAA